MPQVGGFAIGDFESLRIIFTPVAQNNSGNRKQHVEHAVFTLRKNRMQLRFLRKVKEITLWTQTDYPQTDTH